MGGGFQDGDVAQARVGGTDGLASKIGFGNANPPNDDARTMLHFSAMGDAGASYMLPSNNTGGMSTAVPGDMHDFYTVNSNSYPTAPANDLFNMGVTSPDAGTFGTVQAEIRNAPTLVATQSGTLTHDTFGAMPANEGTASDIIINRDHNHSLNFNYMLPSMDFTRPDITWGDGVSHSASPFADGATSGIWIILENATNFYIFGSPFNAIESPFAPMESGTHHAVAGESNIDQVNFFNQGLPSVALGTYDVHYWSIGWDHHGYSDSTYIGLYTGQILQDDLEAHVQIVPEPSSLLALGAMGGLLVSRKRRK